MSVNIRMVGTDRRIVINKGMLLIISKINKQMTGPTAQMTLIIIMKTK